MARFTDTEIAQHMRAAGFSGQHLILAGAICLAESNGDPRALNDNPHTGDLSYGLMQINMIGKLGPIRREWFGIGHNDELFRPSVNCHAAYMLYRSARSKFVDWSTYNHGSHGPFMARMREAVTHVNGGKIPLTRYLYLTHPFLHGADVSDWQRVVGAPVDGQYGPVTAGHTRAWQSAHGLHVDGIVGPHTAKSAGWKWGRK
jgi:peptidoglycan hydrolase-like protein with peptidoglycan-binding domain